MTNNRTLSVLCFVFITVACFNSFVKEALAGGFSNTCNITGFEQDHILNANCKDRSANLRSTSLDLNRRIGNKDGNLTTSGNYQATCKNINLNGISLEADCLTYNKDYRHTSLNLNDVISNNDGNLTFDQ